MSCFICVDIGRIDLIDPFAARCDLGADGLADLKHGLDIDDVRNIFDLTRSIQHHGCREDTENSVFTAADIDISRKSLSPYDAITGHISYPLFILAFLSSCPRSFPEPGPSPDGAGSLSREPPAYSRDSEVPASLVMPAS